MGFSDSTPLGTELRALLGAPDQLMCVEKVVRTEGSGLGSPALLVRNPRGISFEALLDRGMDIGWADAPGFSLAWRYGSGPVASNRFEPTGSGWARSFGGGLLSTCGLASTGAASTIDGVHYPLHGRVGHIPAENVHWQLVGGSQADPDSDEPGSNDVAIEITGDVVEACLGQPTLRLHRTITAYVNRPELVIEDVVMNDSAQTAGHMFRHHLNFGYPLIGPDTVIQTDAQIVGDRDNNPAAPSDMPWTLDVSTTPTEEIVSYLQPPDDHANVTIESTTHRVEVAFAKADFPWLVLWRDASPMVNVLGVEPSTSRDAGRAQASQDGELCLLTPGERRHYRTEICVKNS